MVQRICNFGEGLRKDLAIHVRCDPCDREVLHPSRDLWGYVAPGAEIEDLLWWCLSCGRRSAYVRWCLVHEINQHLVVPWTPPAGMRRWW